MLFEEGDVMKFKDYCRVCRYHTRDPFQDPCRSCLKETADRDAKLENTTFNLVGKPVGYEEATDKKEDVND